MSDGEADVWEPWTMRDFPRGLRQEIVAIAKERRQSPGQFAAAVLAAAKAAGWPRNPFANGQTRPALVKAQPARRPQPTKLERLGILAAIARDLGDGEVSASVARLATAAIAREERRAAATDGRLDRWRTN